MLSFLGFELLTDFVIKYLQQNIKIVSITIIDKNN
jgi:hypothetical protein